MFKNIKKPYVAASLFTQRADQSVDAAPTAKPTQLNAMSSPNREATNALQLPSSSILPEGRSSNPTGPPSNAMSPRIEVNNPSINHNYDPATNDSNLADGDSASNTQQTKANARRTTFDQKMDEILQDVVDYDC